MATLAKMVTKTLDVGVSNTTIDLSATIKSFDVLDTKFIFGITSNQGLAINLSGATVKYIVEYYVEGKTYAIEGNCLVVDINTISFNLPDQLRGYNGKALIGIYATLTDGTKIDLKDIVVKIEPSIMDKGIDFTAKTYFEDFETVKAEVISAGENAKNQINAVLPAIQSQVSELDRQIKALPQIPDLFVAYTNSADGSVDFSRVNPSENLLSNGDFSKGFTNAYIANEDKTVGTIEFVNFKGKQCIKLTNVDFWNISKYFYLVIGDQNGKTRTLEFDALIQQGSLFVDDGVSGSVISDSSSDFVRYKKVITNAYDRNYIAFYGNYTPVTCYLTNFALYDGDVEIQPFLPSRVDNYLDSYMKYIGYSVKNSTNPIDYRWTVNPEWQRAQLDYEKASAIKNNLINLCVNGDFSQNKNGWSIAEGIEYENGHYVKKNPYLYYFQDIPLTNKHIVYVKGTNGVDTNDLGIVSKINLFIIGTYTYLKSVSNTSTVSTSSTLLEINNGGIRIDLSKEGLDENNSVGVWLDDILVYDLTSIFGAGNEPSLEDFERLLSINVSSPTIYSQSILKAELNASPINSILTTLSAENPSTTLGGTWVQLGTESKFDNTIYYWQRTN